MNQLKNNSEQFRVTLEKENPDVEVANLRYERAYRYDVQRMNYRRNERAARDRNERANQERANQDRTKGSGRRGSNPSPSIEHEGIH